MNVPAIRAWLMIAPRPRSVRVSTDGATPQKIEIPEGTSWIQVAESVGALQPDLVEAISADGGTIRAMRPAELDDDEEKEDDGTVGVVQDPESARLIIFARLLADAYRHSTDVAFDKMIAMFEASVRRGEALERSLETTHKILTKAAADQLQRDIEQAAGGTDGRSLFEQLVASFVQGKAQGEAERVAAPTNGAAKPEASS